ncbi:hypothetical protein HDU67_007570 [Dinochytrium kinnereticum]|nr:hypothetical protein HDU67_007570 [Dinochytrium kinnereticum]
MGVCDGRHPRGDIVLLNMLGRQEIKRKEMRRWVKHLDDLASAYGGINYDKFETYLTPAPWALWVWALIHMLFGGFIIWQWFPGTEDIVENGVGPWFAIASLLSAIQVALWDADKLILGVFVTLLACGATSLAYYNLSRNYPAQSMAQNILVHAPISMFHAWFVCIFWVTLLAIFTTVEDPKNPSVFDIVLVLLVQIKLAATASGYTEWRHDSGDVAGASCISWFLFSVSWAQESPWISWPAFILAIYVAVHALFRPAHHHFITSRNSEQEPLLRATGAPGNPPVIPAEPTAEQQV